MSNVASLTPKELDLATCLVEELAHYARQGRVELCAQTRKTLTDLCAYYVGTALVYPSAVKRMLRDRGLSQHVPQRLADMYEEALAAAEVTTI